MNTVVTTNDTGNYMAPFLKPSIYRGILEKTGFANGVSDNITVGQNEWNAAISRSFLVTERFKFRIRGEFFDVFNHPERSDLNTSITSPAFGQVFGHGFARHPPGRPVFVLISWNESKVEQ